MFRKRLLVGESERLYSADHSVCISSLAIEGSDLFWIEGCTAAASDTIVSIDLSLGHPYNPTPIPALQARNGVDVDGTLNKVFWTGFNKVYKATIGVGDPDREEVIDLQFSPPVQLQGLVVVRQ